MLINLHDGGFTADKGSMIETIPVANLTQTKVVAVLYSLTPEHPFPAAVNEAVAVYRELLKTYKPQNIGIYGTSAGAILIGEAASCMWGGGEVGQDRYQRRWREEGLQNQLSAERPNNGCSEHFPRPRKLRSRGENGKADQREMNRMLLSRPSFGQRNCLNGG